MFDYALDAPTGITLGNYHLERLIGERQGGPIYLASTDAGATTYLLHFLAEPTKQGAYERFNNLERFQHLASQIMSLRHPAILPLLDTGTYQGTPYLVSPNPGYNSLRRYLSISGPINAFTVGRYLDSIAAAVDYAHGHGVFHGHLTLDCIFIRPDGRLVVADLGVRSLLELNISGKLPSPESETYAPEQLLGKPTDSVTDVYALGAVLYQLLTGKPVFAGSNLFDVIQQHLFAAVPPLSELRSDLPAELDSILDQALAKDPKERYQQVGALANAYHDVVDPYNHKRVPFVLISSPSPQILPASVPEVGQAEAHPTEPEWITHGSIFDRDSDAGYSEPETPLPSVLEDIVDDPTIKSIAVGHKQTPVPGQASGAPDTIHRPATEEDSDDPTLTRMPALFKSAAGQAQGTVPTEDVALFKQMPVPGQAQGAVLTEDVAEVASPDMSSLLKEMPLLPVLEDVAVIDPLTLVKQTPGPGEAQGAVPTEDAGVPGQALGIPGRAQGAVPTEDVGALGQAQGAVPTGDAETPLSPALEKTADDSTLAFHILLEERPLPPVVADVAVVISPNRHSNRPDASAKRLQMKNTRRSAMIVVLLVLIAGGAVGTLLIFRHSPVLSGLSGLVTSYVTTKILLGLCIVLSVGFFVAFNIISRVSLSTTRHEYAYTVLWQFGCALLVPFFLPFDSFSISISPPVLLLVAVSVVLWALVDVFQFSAFKYEEASVLSGIFPLNFIFTFLVSVVLFHSMITPTVVIGFLIIMATSLLIGGYHTGLRPSKGVIFALLCSFFRGVVLGFNSEIVKSFSITPNMFVGFFFPALFSLLILLRPKKSELRYELQVQWKKILLNAAVLDVYYFFLLKAFQLGNIPQVVALSASSTLLTALAGIVILKEDKHKVLKISVAVLATLGVILVQL